MATAAIGHNNPPPRELHALHIEELVNEAQGFLDGEPISTQAQADSVGQLLGMLREARKGADEQRKIEKAPHDEAAKAVQAVWVPLLDRVALAESVAKRALAPFLAAQEAIARAEANRLRAEADEKAAAARQVLHATDASDLKATEYAEKLFKESTKAAQIATKAEKVKPMAAGHGRAVSLRSRWAAVLSDSAKALKFYREHQPEELKAWLTEQAQRDVNAGARSIDGFVINEERIAQ